VETVGDARLPAFLESSNPRDISICERHGFQNLGTLDVGGRPLMTPMLRPAQKQMDTNSSEDSFYRVKVGRRG